MGYSGAGGKLIHKKTRSKKSRDTVPLNIKKTHEIPLHTNTGRTTTFQTLSGLHDYCPQCELMIVISEK